MCLLRFARQRRTCLTCGSTSPTSMWSRSNTPVPFRWSVTHGSGGGKFSVITSVIIITIVSQFRSQPSFTH